MPTTTRINQTIIDNLRKLMAHKGLNNAELVKKTGITSGTISKILNHKIKITSDRLFELSQGLEVSITELLQGLEQNHSNEPSAAASTSNLNIGILSVGNCRICMVKTNTGKIVGHSTLFGSLSLSEPFSQLLSKTKESIALALGRNDEITNHELKSMSIAMVTHCYEFCETKEKYLKSAQRFFYYADILPDWHATYAASFGQSKGISLVVDKGVSLSYLYDDKLQKLGGWGFPIYDMGGEFWLGMMAIKHTIRTQEGFGSKDTLSEAILAKHGGRLESLIEYCLFNAKDYEKYREFCAILLESYYANVRSAKDIIQSALTEVNQFINKVDQNTGQLLPISINGSLAHLYSSMVEPNRLISPITNEHKVEVLSQLAKTYSQGG